MDHIFSRVYSWSYNILNKWKGKNKMKINLHELEHIKIALYNLRKDNSITERFKGKIDYLYQKIFKFYASEQEKIKVNIEVKDNE